MSTPHPHADDVYPTTSTSLQIPVLGRVQGCIDLPNFAPPGCDLTEDQHLAEPLINIDVSCKQFQRQHTEGGLLMSGSFCCLAS